MSEVKRERDNSGGGGSKKKESVDGGVGFSRVSGSCDGMSVGSDVF